MRHHQGDSHSIKESFYSNILSINGHLGFHIHIHCNTKIQTLTRLSNNYSCTALDKFCEKNVFLYFQLRSYIVICHFNLIHKLIYDFNRLSETNNFRYKMKNNNYYTIGVVPKSNQIIIETSKFAIGTPMSPNHKIYYFLNEIQNNYLIF